MGCLIYGVTLVEIVILIFKIPKLINYYTLIFCVIFCFNFLINSNLQFSKKQLNYKHLLAIWEKENTPLN